MQDIYQAISDEIGRLHLSRAPQGLYAPIQYALDSGGKRVRPALALMAADMLGGKREEVMPLAIALEVFHNFTLLHDDVMDNADTRRGRPAVHKKWNSSTAILSGDQMLIEAYKLVAQVPEQYLSVSLSLFNKMATEICEGQQYDMDFENRTDVAVEQYIEMIRLKTAVLPATALQLGALVSAANVDIQQAIYQFGINLGLAFQLRDDYLDVYGDPDTFGKPIGGDIVEGKKTFLYITAFANADSRQYDLLRTWFTSDDKTAKIENIRLLYSEIGADRICLQEIESYSRKALDNLEAINVEEAAKQPLKDLLNKLLHRNT